MNFKRVINFLKPQFLFFKVRKITGNSTGKGLTHSWQMPHVSSSLFKGRIPYKKSNLYSLLTCFLLHSLFCVLLNIFCLKVCLGDSSVLTEGVQLWPVCGNMFRAERVEGKRVTFSHHQKLLEVWSHLKWLLCCHWACLLLANSFSSLS